MSQGDKAGTTAAPARAGLVLGTLILVAGVANLKQGRPAVSRGDVPVHDLVLPPLVRDCRGAERGWAGDSDPGCILLAVVGPTAGRWYIDLSSGVTPKQFIRGEWFVTIAAFTGLIWILTFWATDDTWIALGVAFVLGYAARVAALWYAWEEPLASEPTGVYKHSDGRPMLGRKLKGKSQRELRDLGLLVEDGNPEPVIGKEATT